MKTYRMANGTETKLSKGEARAIRAMVKANGKHGVQFRPSGVRHDTVKNLARKGVLRFDAVQRMFVFAEGVWE